MTISTTTTTVTLSGNGITTAFSFPFVADSASDLVVTYTTNTGVSNVLSPSLYTVILNPVPSGGLWAVGGVVNYPLTGSPIPAGSSLTITRRVPYTQEISITNQGAFYPRVVEQGLDVLELQLQQIISSLDYALKFPFTDGIVPNTLPPASARANGYLGFDSQGQPIVTTIPTGVSAPDYAEPRVVATTGTATINVLLTDSFSGISIKQSSTPVTIVQLPSGEGPYPIIDGGGNAATYPITVLPPAGKLINGQSSYVLNTDFQSTTMYWDGSQYLIGSGSQGLGNDISVPGSISAGTSITAGTTITAGTRIQLNSGDIVSVAGTVQDSKGDLRDIPKNLQTSSYTLQGSDNGKCILLFPSSLGVNINAGIFSGGNNVMITNLTGGSVNLNQGSGMTMTWAGQDTTGTRFLAHTGVATLWFINGTGCMLSGTGLT